MTAVNIYYNILAAASRPTLSETETKWFMFDISCYAFGGRVRSFAKVNVNKVNIFNGITLSPCAIESHPAPGDSRVSSSPSRSISGDSSHVADGGSARIPLEFLPFYHLPPGFLSLRKEEPLPELFPQTPVPSYSWPRRLTQYPGGGQDCLSILF